MNCLPIFIVLTVFCVSVLGQGRGHMKCTEVVDKDLFEHKKKNPTDNVIGAVFNYTDCSIVCGLQVIKNRTTENVKKSTVAMPDYEMSCGKQGENKWCQSGKCQVDTRITKYCEEKMKKEVDEAKKQGKKVSWHFYPYSCTKVTCYMYIDGKSQNGRTFPTPTYNFTDYKLCTGAPHDQKNQGRYAFCKQGKCVMPDGKRPTFPDEEE